MAGEKKSYTVRLLMPEGKEAEVRVAEDEYILTRAYDQRLELPSMCLQGWCLTCAGRVEGEGEWDQSHSRRYYEKDRDNNFILLCTAQPRSDLTVRTHQRVSMRDCRIKNGLPAPRA
jgi:ferredoxin